MKNAMTEWINESTRYRGNETLSRIDPVITKEPDIIEDIKSKKMSVPRLHFEFLTFYK